MRRIFLRYIGVLKQHVFSYSIGLIGYSLFGTFRQLLLAFILKDLFDSAAAMDFRLLIYSVLKGVGMLFVCATLQPLFRYQMESAVIRSVADYRKKIFYKLENISFAYFRREHSGNIISKLTTDIKEMENGLTNNLSILFFYVVCIAFVVFNMFAMDFWLSIVAICTGLISFLFNALYARSLRELGRDIQGRLGKLNENLSDLLAGVTVIKTFNLYQRLSDKFHLTNQQVFDSGMKRVSVNSRLNSFNELGKMLDLLGCMGVGAYFVIHGKLSAGTIIAIWQLKNPVLSILGAMGRLLTNFMTAMAGAERVFSLEDEDLEPLTYPHLTSTVKPDESFAIQLEGVVFGYGQDETVLNQLSLRVKKGSKVGLVGSSGQGKSTIFKLILGLYQPYQGDILVEGESYSSLSLLEAREKISYVSQNGYLFSGTIMENIRFGRVDASDLEIYQAAKLANAHTFVQNLDSGYQTYVGERGVQLSGGQRQRILIARAILKDAPILLLDEATSALDSESEQLVNEALDRLMEERTTLVIAHRLSTVRDADQIVVIEDGIVIEQGTHEELRQMPGGIYRKLYEEQYKNWKVS